MLLSVLPSVADRTTAGVGVVVQVRYRSERLPGKVLLDLEGAPVLGRLWNRLTRSALAGRAVVATSHDSPEIVDWCAAGRIPVHVGPEEDLLTRILDAARALDAEWIARVTGDNPLTDFPAIEEMAAEAARHRWLLVHNKHRLGLPFGAGAEIIHRSVLEELDASTTGEQARAAAFRDAFGGHRVPPILAPAPPDLLRPQYRLTVDYPEDLDLMRRIFRSFDGRDDFTLRAVVQLLDARPDLAAINLSRREGFPV